MNRAVFTFALLAMTMSHAVAQGFVGTFGPTYEITSISIDGHELTFACDTSMKDDEFSITYEVPISQVPPDWESRDELDLGFGIDQPAADPVYSLTGTDPYFRFMRDVVRVGIRGPLGFEVAQRVASAKASLVVGVTPLSQPGATYAGSATFPADGAAKALAPLIKLCAPIYRTLATPEQIVSSPSKDLGRWTFDTANNMAIAANGSAFLRVTCAEPHRLALVYELAMALLAPETKGTAIEFAFTTDRPGSSQTWTKIEGKIELNGETSYLAMVGKVADQWIARTAGANGPVSVGIGVPNSKGSTIYNITEFSSSGSSVAIRAVRNGC